ncbi:TetR/AcrR family transcriptional regulator [Clostridium cellulovorans]|uniref:Regulatory protein TetR n=1 Tax=Clostridium cellulovorans (strain ATCC 35296 / DSM 3052 / OCM 3 / 743B) TaxID=573061 RepID=D9SWK2_CLOC7|nr:TetR/AcrR family transcriptional regulator [Clostridium cellulovorans]ADL53284.1 regulatory protein TetR [Clostridium cellulovorans 743B]
MSEKAEYKSAIRSRRLIREAFIELIQEKDIEKITVTDIINRADINRGTFYAHYQDIRALMEQISNEIIGKMFEFLGEFSHKNFFQNPLPLLLKISSWLEDDVEFYKTLINSRGSEHFLIKLKEILVDYMKTNSDFPEHAKKSPQFSIHAHFFAGGIINLYEVWLRSEIDSSLKEISQEISMIFVNYSNLFCQKK